MTADAQPDQTNAQRAILIGASYAEGWGSPQLPGLNVTNKGRSGEQTREMLARFENDVLSDRPDAVIIWGHINDIFRAPNGDMVTAAKQARENLLQMIRAAQAAQIRVIIATEVTLSEPGGILNWLMSGVAGLLGKVSYQSRVSGHVRDINDSLRDFAAENGMTLLDLENALNDEDGMRRREFTREDGSHLNDVAYEALTRAAAAQLSAERG